MTRARRRLMLVALAGLGLTTAAVLAATAFQDHLLFFYSPSDIASQPVPPGRSLRLGGLVEEGSVKPLPTGVGITFVVTDLVNEVPVTYAGAVPDLFREGQGVIAQGQIGPDGVLIADEVLAKHDENYMPPEVADALRAAGQWQGPDGGQAPK